MWQYNYDYLSHSIKGHKYIDRKMGKNGKWQYIYDIPKKVKYTINKQKAADRANAIVHKIVRAENPEERAQIIQNVGQEFKGFKDKYGEEAALDLTTVYAITIKQFLENPDISDSTYKELEILLQEIGNLRNEISTGEKKKQAVYWHNRR